MRPWKAHIKDIQITKRQIDFKKILQSFKASRELQCHGVTHRILTIERHHVNTDLAQQRFWCCSLGMPLTALSCGTKFKVHLLHDKQHLDAYWPTNFEQICTAKIRHNCNISIHNQAIFNLLKIQKHCIQHRPCESETSPPWTVTIWAPSKSQYKNQHDLVFAVIYLQNQFNLLN